MNILKKKREKIKLYIFMKLFIIINISLILYSLEKEYRFCLRCIDNDYVEKLDFKCNKCSNELVFRDFHIASTKDTLKEIITHNKSISRFGDGELNIIIHYHGVSFQKFDRKLLIRLQEILNSKNKNVLIGINIPYKKRLLRTYTRKRRNYFNNYFNKNKFRIIKVLNKNIKYYSSRISRFYVGLKDKSKVLKFIKKLKKIWEGRDILIVEGEYSRLGFRNDLFNNTNSIKRIICPSKNAFKSYDRILKAVLKIKKTYLIIIALGPTATVLSYDLSKYGYQAIDLGHADIEYELYLRKATKMIPIPNKYVNEAKGKKQKIGKIYDIDYNNQIIDKILF